MSNCKLLISLRSGLLAVLLLLFAGSPALLAQNVTEYIRVDSLKVGDTFSYTLVLSKDQTYDHIQFPDSTQFGSDFEVRDLQRYNVSDFKDSLIYSVQFFGTENTRIPSLPIALASGTDTTTVNTTPVPIYFKSVLQTENDDFRPLKPIFDFARAWWPYLLALILLGFAGWYLYRWYRAKSEEPEPAPKPTFTPKPFKNPLDRLINSIQALHSYTFEEEEDFKNFYIQLGDAIRTYFEDLYNIPALESTSREIIYELEKRMVDERMVDERMIKQTRKVLRQADMVKFARFQPTEEQTSLSLTIAQDFVDVAREIDGPRIEQMRRKHQAKVERERKAFEEESESKELENA